MLRLLCILVCNDIPELRNVTNILIANLSCSDILMCVVCLPVTVIYTLMDRWVLGEALCKVTPFVQCVSVTVSVFSLVLIALERHQLILHPTGWSPAAGHSYLAVGLTWLLAGYGLPLLLVLLCYLRIFLRLRRRRDMLDRSRRTQSAHRINVMLLCIVVAFALCWLPLTVFNTLFDWHHQALPDCQHNAVFSACHLTAMASTCINPVVYGFLNSNFQRELKATLQHCRCGGGPAEIYESFPLSTVGSEGTTKNTSMNRMGSVCVLSPKLEISSAIRDKTIPANT
ncbi:hypothetical protein F7725_014954 [Dissostichus mawsoni]|uniref:G-protein coupled receptors family 1 profile domain-containing protein n=1 Tax=Dissostichus mawsoni TaxID=36200 RepID=A0A7J5YJ06_DISMA|nr:hypothetical protein F7725_014954 [Dissostichus mawsoni]